jgi:probable HAF family extracellular repeat protein
MLVWLTSMSLACAGVRYTVVNLDDSFIGITNYSSVATGINNLGQVSGIYDLLDGSRIGGFTYSPEAGFTDLGGGNTRVFGINDSGQVAGYEFSSAFRFTPGVGRQYFGTFGGSDSLAYGINNRGQVAGTADLSPDTRHAFLYADGVGLQDLGSLFGGSSRAWDVNNHGWVCGQSDGFNAFLYRDGIGMTYLGPGEGRAINDNGIVVGEDDLATMYRDGQTIYLGDLGGNYGIARGINNSNVVVGESGDSERRLRAFRWTEAEGMVDLNSLIDPNSGWLLFQAFAINDRGQIVGWGRKTDKDVAVLLEPVQSVVILKQPKSLTRPSGHEVSFSVMVSGTTPAFQWRFNNTPIAGATNSTLSFQIHSIQQAGNYSCMVTNWANAVTSSVAHLSVVGRK